MALWNEQTSNKRASLPTLNTAPAARFDPIPASPAPVDIAAWSR
jgi:hypothetical protein